jgi:Protein of unknown function (DUF2848)
MTKGARAVTDPAATGIAFTATTRGGARPLAGAIDSLVIAGWTGRDAAAVEAHVAELERLGVKRPKTTPIFYRVGASLLTTAASIEVAGPDTSGEVEPVLIGLADGLWVGVGSDHTDRKAEAVGVTLAKQLCPKPVSAALWPFDEVADHWDALVLRSFATDRSGRRLYQEGAVAALRPPGELMARYLKSERRLPPGMAMFCGTLAVKGEIAPAARFEIELEDPVLGRRLAHAYRVVPLPVEG